jgi:hypothetical protein
MEVIVRGFRGSKVQRFNGLKPGTPNAEPGTPNAEPLNPRRKFGG